MIQPVEQTPFQAQEAATRGSLARQVVAMLVRRKREAAARARRFMVELGPECPLTQAALTEELEASNAAEYARRILYGWEL